MITALLIVAALIVVFAIVGVVCEIAGGSFFAIFHLLNNTLGCLFELLGSIFDAIADENK